jgi:hypothetical protein
LNGKEREGEKVKARRGGRRRQDAISGKRNIVSDGNSTLGQIYNLRASLTLPVQGKRSLLPTCVSWPWGDGES